MVISVAMIFFNSALLHLESRFEDCDKPLLLLLKLGSKRCCPYKGPAEEYILLVTELVKLSLKFLLSCQVLNSCVRILQLSSKKSPGRRIELVEISIML